MPVFTRCCSLSDVNDTAMETLPYYLTYKIVQTFSKLIYNNAASLARKR